jgi:hypothetical protein
MPLPGMPVLSSDPHGLALTPGSVNRMVTLD